MLERKQSFLERLTGTKTVFDEDEISSTTPVLTESDNNPNGKPWSSAVYHREYPSSENETDRNEQEEVGGINQDESEEESDIPGLAIDVYESDNELVIQSMIAGVTPENLHIDVTRTTVIIDGTRIAPKDIPEEHYVQKELYWGKFLREITLPYEIDPEGAEAVEKYGLLIIRLPRLNKSRSQKLKVKSI